MPRRSKPAREWLRDKKAREARHKLNGALKRLATVPTENLKTSRKEIQDKRDDAARYLATFETQRPNIIELVGIVRSALEPLKTLIKVPAHAWPTNLGTAPYVSYLAASQYAILGQQTSDFSDLRTAIEHALQPRGIARFRILSSQKRAQLEKSLGSLDVAERASRLLAKLVSGWINANGTIVVCDDELNALDYALKKRSALVQKEAEKRGSLEKIAIQRARLGSLDDETRALTERFKGLIAFDGSCVYCMKAIIRGENAHLDHIIPVSKGGLATAQNLVWACDRCNLAKRDHGLVRFLKAANLDIDTVCNRLLRLGKFV